MMKAKDNMTMASIFNIRCWRKKCITDIFYTILFLYSVTPYKQVCSAGKSEVFSMASANLARYERTKHTKVFKFKLRNGKMNL